jgi:phosphoadenosine phosphosulfate reductase
MQLTFENKTIDQLSIELIQAYEPPEGYYLGFSGGKDSVVIYDLARRSGVKFSAHYSVSPIDPPQIHKFIKEQYPDVIWDKLAKNFWNVHVLRNGLPLRQQRWCCRLIKESGGNGLTKILGMRKAESFKRSKYTCFDSKFNNLKPILNWSDLDVWQYIAERNLNTCSLYKEGFTRIGCVLCPYAGKDETKLQLSKFPKIVNCWKLAADHYVKKRIERGTPLKFTTGEEYFNWWIKR